MNEIIKNLENRKSIRVYKDKKISEEIKEVLLKAAISAPSAGNQMMYSIIEVEDDDLKEKLSKSCDNQAFIASAPLIYIFLADITRWKKAYKLYEADSRDQSIGDLVLSITDTLIAAQNLVVAASSLNIGSCYIGDILENCDYHRELLNLPSDVMPVAMLTLGYPVESALKREKPKRFDLKYIVGKNTYRHLSDKEVIDCFDDYMSKNHPKSLKSTKDRVVQTCKRKFNSDFSLEMQESVKKYLKSFMKELD